MSIKKILRIASFVMLIGVAVPASAGLTVPPSTYVNSPAKPEDPRAQQLIQRLDEIKNMDKSSLTSSEKKNLRKEVKGIKKEMRSISGGVYLSAGAIIIIILLLIILL